MPDEPLMLANVNRSRGVPIPPDHTTYAIVSDGTGSASRPKDHYDVAWASIGQLLVVLLACVIA